MHGGLHSVILRRVSTYRGRFVHSRLHSRSGCFPRASRKALQSRLQALSRSGAVKELIVKFNRDFPRMPPFIHDRVSVFVYIQPVSWFVNPRTRSTERLNSSFRSVRIRHAFRMSCCNSSRLYSKRL